MKQVVEPGTVRIEPAVHIQLEGFVDTGLTAMVYMTVCVLHMPVAAVHSAAHRMVMHTGIRG